MKPNPRHFRRFRQPSGWGAVTLTTVGNGDVYPVTPLGRAIGVIVAILGIGLFALPASILVGGFVDEIESSPDQCPHCSEDLPETKIEV